MSARKFDQALADCACGAKPCIHKTQAGRTFLYYVSCTRCGVQTAKTDSDQEAYAAWDEGDVGLPLELTNALPRRGEVAGTNL